MDREREGERKAVEAGLLRTRSLLAVLLARLPSASLSLPSSSSSSLSWSHPCPRLIVHLCLALRPPASPSPSLLLPPSPSPLPEAAAGKQRRLGSAIPRPPRPRLPPLTRLPGTRARPPFFQLAPRPGGTGILGSRPPDRRRGKPSSFFRQTSSLLLGHRPSSPSDAHAAAPAPPPWTPLSRSRSGPSRRRSVSSTWTAP